MFSQLESHGQCNYPQRYFTFAQTELHEAYCLHKLEQQSNSILITFDIVQKYQVVKGFMLSLTPGTEIISTFRHCGEGYPRGCTFEAMFLGVRMDEGQYERKKTVEDLD